MKSDPSSLVLKIHGMDCATKFAPGQIISRSHRVTEMHENEIGTLAVDSAVPSHELSLANCDSFSVAPCLCENQQ
jgi:hypothetical protein